MLKLPKRLKVNVSLCIVVVNILSYSLNWLQKMLVLRVSKMKESDERSLLFSLADRDSIISWKLYLLFIIYCLSANFLR